MWRHTLLLLTSRVLLLRHKAPGMRVVRGMSTLLRVHLLRVHLLRVHLLLGIHLLLGVRVAVRILLRPKQLLLRAHAGLARKREGPR